jgi:GTP:adenosylcobinamide-phosphate guanylyltransferase
MAGGRSDPSFESAFGVGRKWEVDVAGEPMIRRVLDGLRAARLVCDVHVCGPPRALRAAGVSEPVLSCEGDSLSATLGVALRRATDERALLIAADVPLVGGTALDRWIAACLEADADLCFPVVSWDAMQARLPGARKTWYDLRDGRFTKGNMVVVHPSALRGSLDRVDRLYDTRKRKRWARAMPGGFLKRMALGRLTVADVSSALSTFLGCSVEAVMAEPELAVDVDEVEDVAFVRSVLTSHPLPVAVAAC